jgi:DNA-binding CsgD family transcriptional regulator
MLERIFDDLAQATSGIASVEDAHPVLARLARDHGLEHAAYLAVNIPRASRKAPFYSATYSDEWCRHYQHANYVDIDPVVSGGLRGVLPLDWSEFDRADARVRRLFGEAGDAGLGDQGLTFPIRGRGGETALFSINARMAREEWVRFKKRYMPEFQLFAFHLHTSVVQAEGGLDVDFDARLSGRERECLQWAATGKTTWETSVILKISERAVRFYLDSARSKLDCLTKTQAVAKAVALGIVRVG